MKAAAVEWRMDELKALDKPEELIDLIKGRLELAEMAGVNLIVFPGFTGCYYQQLCHGDKFLKELKKRIHPGKYIEDIKMLSKYYGAVICPGSYWESADNNVYHSSCILSGGNMILEQRQIYLARWERGLALTRGVSMELKEIMGWKMGIVLSTDVFYPQVSRMLALRGADIILSPVGFTDKRNEALQVSGMWQEAQQNLFFAVESGFNGRLGERDFWGESMIHAPLGMTDHEDGFLARSRGEQKIVVSELDNKKRKETVSSFDVLSQLNPEFYRNMKMFGEDSENGGCAGKMVF